MVARSSNAAKMIRIFGILHPIPVCSILNIGPPPKGESRKFFCRFPNTNNNTFFVNGMNGKLIPVGSTRGTRALVTTL